MAANEMPPQLLALRDQAKEWLARGESVESVIEFVREESPGTIGTVWVVEHALGISLRDAIELVEYAPVGSPPEREALTRWRELVASVGLARAGGRHCDHHDSSCH